MGNVGNANGFCYQTSGIWQFAGYGVMIFKIVIPVILIILGIVALGKAVISNDEKDIKTAINSMIKKFIAAVVIFFVPSIVSALFSAIGSFSDVKEDYEVCVKCITGPNKQTCKNAVTNSQK